ncbi:hypothetical protein F2P56_009514, partial [Juglans regia]
SISILSCFCLFFFFFFFFIFFFSFFLFFVRVFRSSPSGSYGPMNAPTLLVPRGSFYTCCSFIHSSWPERCNWLQEVENFLGFLNLSLFRSCKRNSLIEAKEPSLDIP